MNGIVATVIVLLAAAFGATLVIYDFDIPFALGGMFSGALLAVGLLVVAASIWSRSSFWW